MPPVTPRGATPLELADPPKPKKAPKSKRCADVTCVSAFVLCLAVVIAGCLYLYSTHSHCMQQRLDESNASAICQADLRRCLNEVGQMRDFWQFAFNQNRAAALPEPTAKVTVTSTPRTPT
jgi:hypothetical protein